MVDKRKLEVARGRLVVAMGRDVEWKELAEMAGMSEYTLNALRNGRTGGSARTIGRLVETFRAKGVAISLTDLIN